MSKLFFLIFLSIEIFSNEKNVDSSDFRIEFEFSPLNIIYREYGFGLNFVIGNDELGVSYLSGINSRNLYYKMRHIGLFDNGTVGRKEFLIDYKRKLKIFEKIFGNKSVNKSGIYTKFENINVDNEMFLLYVLDINPIEKYYTKSYSFGICYENKYYKKSLFFGTYAGIGIKYENVYEIDENDYDAYLTESNLILDLIIRFNFGFSFN